VILTPARNPDGTSAVVRLVRDGPVPRASCPHCGGGLQLSTVGSRWKVTSPSDVADRLVLQLGTLEREELHVLLLDARNVVIDQVRVYQGSVARALVRVAELFTEAVRRHAHGILLCHNHPSGDPTPSPDDLNLTAEALAAGRLLDIVLLDHIIVGGGSWVSLRERGITFAPRREGHVAGERRGPAGSGSGQGRPRLRVEDGEVRDESGRVYDIRDAIEALPWTTALPSSGAPHQYCVLNRSPVEAWDVLATAIARHPDSYLALHRGYKKPQRYWEFEGRRYWRTSAGSRAGGITMMLNRCLLESDTPRRVDQGARPIEWDGPPWLEYGSPWPPGWIYEGPGAGNPNNNGWVYHLELDARQHYRCVGCGERFFWTPGRPCRRCGTHAPEVIP